MTATVKRPVHLSTPRAIWLVKGLAAAAVLAYPAPSFAQGQEIVIRPTSEYEVLGITNPQHARDDSEYSAAGASWGRVCHTHCDNNPVVARATWDGFPDGYRVVRLEVKWKANAGMQLYGNDAAEVMVRLEYNAGSGWSTAEEYTWTATTPPCPNPSNGSITCSDHVTVISLGPDVRPSDVKVRITMSVNLTHCDNCWLRVSNAVGGVSVFDIRLISDLCYIPIGESTTATGYDAPDPTWGGFRQTLIPPTSSIFFGGRKVKEADPGGGGPDTCYSQVTNPAFSPYTSVTGGTWQVGADNAWGPDYIGYGTQRTDYYRNENPSPVPCETSFSQQMLINCGDNWVPYATTAIRAGINSSTVWSQRALTLQQNTWP